MVIQILEYVLCFISGIFFNMSILHLFAYFETRNHAIIAKSKRPYLASKIWGGLFSFSPDRSFSSY